MGRNCVTALPVAVVHRSGRQCTGRCSNSRYLSTHHPHVRVGRPSWYVRYQCSTCVCDDQRSANLPTSRSTQKGTRQSIGGLQGHWPNRRLVGIGNRTIQQLDPTWAGSTLSVVASGTHQRQCRLRWQGHWGRLRRCQWRWARGDLGRQRLALGTRALQPPFKFKLHIRMAPKRTGKGMLAALERATTPRLPTNGALIC